MALPLATDTHATFATIHRKVAIRQSRTGLFESLHTKNKKENHTIRHDSLFIGGDGEIRSMALPLATDTHAGTKTVHRTVFLASLVPCSNLLFYLLKKTNTNHKGRCFLLAVTERFELSCGCPQTHFEQKAVSTPPPLSVPENCNISICSARF